MYICALHIKRVSFFFFAFAPKTNFYLLGGDITLLRMCKLESRSTVGFISGTNWNWLAVPVCRPAWAQGELSIN